VSAPLLLLPLDDRPINLDFPLLLAEVAGEQLVTPPRALLGHFLTPGNGDALASWLQQVAPTAGAGIISCDMLAYGGLVASRTPVVTVEEALQRLSVLREIKRRQPALRLLAFSVIMRLTITGSDPATRAAGRDIFRYSILRDQHDRLGDASIAAELAEVEARIPPALLAAYLQARARNHAVNRAAIDLLGDGVLDYLALVQEDTAPVGLHVAEQADLTQYARERAPDDRWLLYAGTDEAAQTLLARYLVQETGLAYPVAVHFRDREAAKQPALFEDVPLQETVRRHIMAVGGTLREDGTPLAVHTFTPPQPDLFEMSPLPAPTWQCALAQFPPMSPPHWPAGLDALAVADTAYCNGGDPHLLHALLADGSFPHLLSYAGWNTAGNTLGTTLAHAALRRVALARGTTPAMETAQQTALFVRLLDDGLYQSVVRAWIARQVEESGVSPLNLGKMTQEVEARVDAVMHELWHELCAQYPAAAALDRPFRTTLPWGRLFEIAIITRKDE